jgi:hypothetical protein
MELRPGGRSSPGADKKLLLKNEGRILASARAVRKHRMSACGAKPTRLAAQIQMRSRTVLIRSAPRFRTAGGCRRGFQNHSYQETFK